MKEENIDSMKYRKATHLAGVDVDMLEDKVLTIKKCWYETGVNVSGNKTDGYFISFIEPVKDMVVNSTNRATITKILRKKGLDFRSARNIGNWSGLKIELSFNENIKMMGKVVGGIRVVERLIQLPELKENTPEFDKVVAALDNGYTIEQIETKYTLTEQIKSKLDEKV